ncbi:iron complex transport system ATP-binding protein [Paenibacillus shirakamiensis]|uniref:Iron complex transport system ATP-binding protein n=1 Tax=Paenibacillus shirakamiensis TaxID=1265935 RepID=A0ABS4JJH7_9BACL|nr:ABC transporter ATP-binding protein [Paenibacillus shirakamiensis]MBP2001861.1 iron complex transport system ATP-binding protein [Paenibacillus shirakamiensis]
MSEALAASRLAFGYTTESIVQDLSLDVREGEWLGIVGPNGSGKSTVLRMLARLASPRSGEVQLDGHNLKRLSTKHIAQRMTMLAQVQEAALDITVRDLVRRGRHPHLKWYEECRGEQEDIVDWALQVTKMELLQHRSLLMLSGGERQRAWLAMAMAQTPKILLLDEPTTYLDIAHQLELMELIRQLNQDQGLTVVMVLHDLNQAARYCDRLIAVKQGAIVQEGTPSEIFQPSFFREVFGIEARIFDDNGVPVYMPSGISPLESGSAH